jgi:tRNA A22 N-methylase
MVRLSPRLQAMYDLAKGPETLWDVGCDHGLLAAYNSWSGDFKKVVCVDRSANVIQKLPIRFSKEYGMNQEQMANIELLCCDGADIPWDRVDGSLVMGGVGCLNIINVLDAAPLDVFGRVKMAFCPQDGPALLEDYLNDHLLKWQAGTPTRALQLVSQVVIERGRKRTIFALSVAQFDLPKE